MIDRIRIDAVHDARAEYSRAHCRVMHDPYDITAWPALASAVIAYRAAWQRLSRDEQEQFFADRRGTVAPRRIWS